MRQQLHKTVEFEPTRAEWKRLDAAAAAAAAQLATFMFDDGDVWFYPTPTDSNGVSCGLPRRWQLNPIPQQSDWLLRVHFAPPPREKITDEVTAAALAAAAAAHSLGESSENDFWQYAMSCHVSRLPAGPSWPTAVPNNDIPRRGIKNLGNSSYQSSVLQCLCVTPLRAVLARSAAAPGQDLSPLAAALHGVFRALRSRPQGYYYYYDDYKGVDASAVKQAVAEKRPEFGTNEQHDASEFLAEVLNMLCGHSSGVNDLFAFRLRQQITCKRCGTACSNNMFENNRSLDLPIPPPPGRGVTLRDCLASYVSARTMSDYACSKCACETISEKRTTLDSLPKVLVMTLNRFKQVEGEQTVKVDAPIAFPLQIDMGRYLGPHHDCVSAGPTRFRLVGHVTHRGASPADGRYTATTWDVADNKWMRANDDYVNPRGGQYLDVDAYMLFYVREDVDMSTLV
jgi:ubiquitin C-terminal hydrolase